MQLWGTHLASEGRKSFTTTPVWWGSWSLFLWAAVRGIPFQEATHAWFPLPMGLFYVQVKGEPWEHEPRLQQPPSGVGEAKRHVPSHFHSTTMGHFWLQYTAQVPSDQGRCDPFSGQDPPALFIPNVNIIITARQNIFPAEPLWGGIFGSHLNPHHP